VKDIPEKNQGPKVWSAAIQLNGGTATFPYRDNTHQPSVTKAMAGYSQTVSNGCETPLSDVN